MAQLSAIQEKAYNQERFFFWFDTNYKLVKVYDRKYCVDHLVGTKGFNEIFREAVSKLHIPAILELKGRVIESNLKRICDETVFKKAQKLAEN